MYAIMARLVPHEEAVPDIEARLRELAQLAVDVDGAVDYRVHRDDDGALLVFESYPTADARAAHLAQPAVADFLTRLAQWLTEPPRVELATQLGPVRSTAGPPP